MRKKYRIGLERLDLGSEGFHLKLQAWIGGVPAILILDTGASASVFDTCILRQIDPALYIESTERVSAGLGTASMESFRTVLPLLQLGKLQLNDFEAAVLDLSHINAAYQRAGLPVVHGILGNDILEKYRAKIDYAASMLVLEAGSAWSWLR